jgi:HAD superfamily hydrolase (TIGR01509 family)
MIGVLFKVNKFQLFINAGILDSILYTLLHFKSPINTVLEFLDKTSKIEKENYFHIKYKKYSQPKYITDWIMGEKTSKQVGDAINKDIEKLDAKNYFKSRLEKKVIKNIVNSIYDPTQVTKVIKPNSKILDLIKTLKEKKYKIFLLSNIDKESLELLQRSYKKIFSFFDGIIFSCNVKLLKPDPLIYDYCIKKYHLTPKQTVLIDDQKDNIRSAKKIGIQGIWYKNFLILKNQLKQLNIS